MSDVVGNDDAAGGEAPRALPGERRVKDRRSPWRMWIPTYVLTYVDRIGSHGVTLYALLAWHCTRESPVRWPSLAQLAKRMAVSRSTVERTMRLLRAVKLLETEACMDEQGQRSNYFVLIDPPEWSEQTGSQGTTVAGAVSPDGAPLSPVKGGDITGERGAPSPMTAPSGDNGSEEEVCVEGDTHAPCAAPPKQTDLSAVEKLAAQWIAQLPPGGGAWKDAQAAEIRWWVGLLLRDGWTKEQLEAAIDEPGRKRGEWPREWGQRLGPRPPKVTPEPSKADKVAQERSQRAAAVAELQADPIRAATLEELHRFVGRRRTAPADHKGAIVPLTDRPPS